MARLPPAIHQEKEINLPGVIRAGEMHDGNAIARLGGGAEGVPLPLALQNTIVKHDIEGILIRKMGMMIRSPSDRLGKKLLSAYSVEVQEKNP
jgi:hypothetical protein